jgi:hypothetical protein
MMNVLLHAGTHGTTPDHLHYAPTTDAGWELLIVMVVATALVLIGKAVERYDSKE